MKRKKIITLVLAGMLALGAVGGTFAWFSSSDNAQNDFSVANGSGSDSDVDIYEKFTPPTGIEPGDSNEKIVQVKNIGYYDQFIRIKITPSWKDNATGTLDNTLIIPIENASVKTDFSAGSWYKEGDYYYYMGKVPAGGFTAAVIDKVQLSLSADRTYQNKDYKVTVETTGVQASNDAYLSEFTGISDGLKTALAGFQDDTNTYDAGIVAGADNNTKNME